MTKISKNAITLCVIAAKEAGMDITFDPKDAVLGLYKRKHKNNSHIMDPAEQSNV